MADKWYNDQTLVTNLGNALLAADVLEDQADFKQYLNKPFKYSEYYAAWEQAGFPDEDDNNWDEFVEVISSDDESDEDDESEEDATE